MDIQLEVQKIHGQFGTTEKANYEIQKLFDKLISEDRNKQLKTFINNFDIWFKKRGDKTIILQDLKDYVDEIIQK